MIFLVGFKVFSEVVDAVCQKRDLNFWRTGIGGMLSKLFNNWFLNISKHDSPKMADTFLAVAKPHCSTPHARKKVYECVADLFQALGQLSMAV